MKQLIHRIQGIYGTGEARAVVRYVLEEEFGLTYTQMCVDGVSSLNNIQRERLENIMSRLEKGEPVQYALGYAVWDGMRLQVTHDTLIPRPETVGLVQCTIAKQPRPQGVMHHNDTVVRVLDAGTGSGCVAIAMARRLAATGGGVKVCVDAFDVCDGAVKVAAANAKAMGVDVNVFRGDMLDAGLQLPHDSYDILVSNPPYVCRSESDGMSSWVLDHEPARALFVPDDDPLLFYRALGLLGQRCLAGGGRVAMECNTRFVGDVASLLAQQGYGDVHTHDDCYDKPRFVTARLL